MKNRGLYIALAVFMVASLAYYATGGSKAPVATSSPSPSATPVIHLTSAEVRTLVIKAKGKVLTVTQAAGKWTFALCPDTQADCPASPADPIKAGVLVSAIVQLRPTTTFPGLVNGLPAYGLDKPTNGQIDIETVGGTRYTLLIGAKSPDSVSEYIRVSTSNNVSAVAASTIDTQILSALDTPPAPAPSPSPQASPSAAPAGPVLPAPSPSPTH